MVTVGGIVSGMAWNVAVTVFVAVTATVHCVPAAESHPLQLPKVEFVSGTAVSPTVAPLANRAEQLEPQVIPEGALVTVPDPVPALTTESANDGVIVNVSAFDVPPPGAGLRTLTWAVPAAAISLAEIAACNWAPLTNVVARSAPFHRTTELDVKLLPFTVRTRLGAPARAVFGTSEVSEGTGLGVASHTPVTAPRPGPGAVLSIKVAMSAPGSLPSTAPVSMSMLTPP